MTRQTTSAFLRQSFREDAAIAKARRTVHADGVSSTTEYPLGAKGTLHVYHNPLETRNSARWTEIPTVSSIVYFIEFMSLLVFYILECTDVWDSYAVGQTQFFAIHGTLLVYEAGLLDELIDGRYISPSTTYHRLRAGTIMTLLPDSLALGRQIYFNTENGWGDDESAQFAILITLCLCLVWRLICVSAAIHTTDPVHTSVIYDFRPEAKDLGKGGLYNFTPTMGHPTKDN